MRAPLWTLTAFSALAFAIGCNNADDVQEYTDVETEEGVDEMEHDHHHEGPHGGHVIELTDDHSVHGEFVLSETDGVGRFYLLGGDLESEVMAESVTYMPAEGDAVEFEAVEPGDDGMAAVFEASFDALPSTDIEELEGAFTVTKGDQTMEGPLTHDHDHDHDHEGEEAHAAE
jgi:hypothetical protein